MAQAARLNLRMQKEIKLLLTDPPPGATFPFLSSQSDSSSPSSSSSGIALTSIDAQIEGPEGSVYENGIFKLKIQIPERYPFQPPIVMFSTPIYHPNIDTGGRICLDILNLPPKGAWQPSLNISTVMTSIGLLLSEPNPDDGLMQEASREYKYNRQAFDHKARSMTEKYARAGSVEMPRETPSELNKDPAENLESMIPIKPVCDDFINLKRMHGVSKKLSLVASESLNQKKADREEVNHGFKSNLTLTELNQTDDNLQCTKKKLRLGSKPVEKGDSLTAGKPDRYSPPQHCKPEADVEKSTKCFSLRKNEFGSQQNLRGSENYHLSTSMSIMDDHQSIQISPKDDKKQCSASKQSLHRNIPPPPPEAASLRADEEGRSRFTCIRNKKLGLTSTSIMDHDQSIQISPKDEKKQCSASEQSLHRNIPPPPPEAASLRADEEGRNRFTCIRNKKLGLTSTSIMDDDQSIQINPKDDKKQGSEISKSLHRNIPPPPEAASLRADEEGQNRFTCIRSKKLGLTGRRLPLDKLRSNQKSLQHNEKELETKTSDEKLVGSTENQEQASPALDSVVVLDSEEESEEDEKAVPARSKLSLVRRRLPVKRKS